MHYDEENFVGLLETYCYTKAAGWERAAVQARREIGRRQNRRRVFVPQSMMASGILSATRAVPRIPAQDAIPEAQPTTRASPLTTPEVPTDVGILLARQAALRNEEEARPISAYPSAGASVGVMMFGEAVGVVTVGTAVGVGEVGASASAGCTGVFIGDRPGRLPGILGGMALTGTARGRLTLTITIRIIATTGPTIRRPTDRIHPRIRLLTATHRQTTWAHQTRTMAPTVAPTLMTTISILTPDRAQATTARSRTARPRSPKLRRRVRLQRLSRLVPQGSRFSSPGRRCAQG